MVEGILMHWSDVQLPNAIEPITSSPSQSSTWISCVQSQNASPPITLTVDGIYISSWSKVWLKKGLKIRIKRNCWASVPLAVQQPGVTLHLTYFCSYLSQFPSWQTHDMGASSLECSGRFFDTPYHNHHFGWCWWNYPTSLFLCSIHVVLILLRQWGWMS